VAQHECAVRARHLQSVFSAIEKLGDPRRQQVLATIGPEVARAVDGATGLEWLPIAHDIALTQALHRALGPHEFQRFYRSLFSDVFLRPVYAGFARATRAVFGFDPVGWMRWLPEMWVLSFRGCGSWQVQRAGAGRATLSLSELPAGALVDRVWTTAVAAALSACFDIAGLPGEIELVEADPQARRARFEMRWREAT
jgi:hypothetical protein